MQYRELGKTGVKVSEISFGCWTMGGLNWVNGTPNGWADVNEDEITAGIKAALDAGFRGSLQQLFEGGEGPLGDLLKDLRNKN